ncbi:MAG: hypothetical protein ACM3JH_07105 [Acidithiobacillales bacterium]
MKAILLGTNRFVDCDRAIAIDGRPLFTLTRRPDESLALSVEVTSPPARQEIRIKENVVLSGPVQVKSDARGLNLLLDGHRLFSARARNDVVEVSLDLRPVGLAIYSDASGLYLGASVFSGNTFRATTGIELSTGL